MDTLKSFEEYADWLRTVYEEDPLCMLTQYTNIDIPTDNQLIVLSASPDELERMLSEMGFVPQADTTSSQKTRHGTPWISESITLSHRDYVLDNGLTYVQYEAVDHTKTVDICHDNDGTFSFTGRGEKVGEMSIHTQLILHPYNRNSNKCIPPEQYAIMREVYERNGQNRIDNCTIQELLQDKYFNDSGRIFADEVMIVIEYLSRQDCQAAYQHYKNPALIATHNVSLK